MEESAHPSIDALLSHAGWVRKLARELAASAAEADDLAQETFAAALTARPHAGHGFAAWLATTLRNAHARTRRRAHVRERLEPLAARSEQVQSTAELAEQADLQRALVEHVLALDEPHRGVLLLRYFAELAPREIARREGLPLATVTSRLTRAHHKLRERLEHAQAERGAWLRALIPLVGAPKAWTTVTVGGVVVNIKLIGSAAALVLTAALVVWLQRDPPRGAQPEPGVGEFGMPAAQLARGAESKELPDAPELPAPRESLAAAPTAARADPAAPAETAPARVRGRVVDSSGAPLARITLGWSGAKDGQVASDARGAFELQTRADQGQIEAFDPAWTNVRLGSWRADSKLEPIVIVARALELAGVVQDEQGRPLSGARIALAIPSDFLTRFEGSLEATRTRGWSTLSDASGRFSLPQTPAIEGAVLRIVLEGYTGLALAEPLTDDTNLVLTLMRPTTSSSGGLRGRVIDERALPVSGARVFLGLASTTSDSEGNFAIALARAVSSDRIVAIKSGFRPALLDRPRPARGDETGWPDFIELQLPGPALTLRGVVQSADGTPRPGIRVWIADPTPAGAIGQMPTFAENLMAGAPIPPYALESEARAPKQDGDNFNDFYQHAKQSSAFWHWVESDADGRFEIGGLDDRRYRLRLMEPRSLELVTTESLRPGGDTERIVLPPPNLWPLVSGRVLDNEGKPLAGVDVRLDGEPVGVRSRVFGGRVYVSMREPRETVRTDAEGRFELEDVPRTGMHLMLESERIVPYELVLADQPNPTSFDLHVHTRCAFELRVTSRDLQGDAVAMLDAEGKPLDILVIDNGGVNAYTDVALTDGRSGVVSVSSAAATVVLLKDGQVVQRSPVRLRSEGTNLIEL